MGLFSREKGIPNIKIGDTTIVPIRRLPGSAFTANAILRRSTNRSQSGKLFVQTLFERYEVGINGLSQELYADIREEYERDEFIDLFFITDRKEVFSGDGSQVDFFTTRRVRLDDTLILPKAEHPIGVDDTGDATFVNEAARCKVTFGTPPASGTNNIAIRYFPIIKGVITELSSEFEWATDEETWSLTFLED